MTALVVLDVETNGLTPGHHLPWEIAWWDLHSGRRETILPWIGHPYEVAAKYLAVSEFDALRVNHFVDRWTNEYRAELDYGAQSARHALYRLVNVVWPSRSEGASVASGGHRDPADRGVMVCVHPEFDLAMVQASFRQHGTTIHGHSLPPWKHRAIDLGSMAIGTFGLDPSRPPSAEQISELCHVEPGDHSATGDVTSAGRCVLVMRQARRRGIHAPADIRGWAATLTTEEIDSFVGEAA